MQDAAHVDPFGGGGVGLGMEWGWRWSGRTLGEEEEESRLVSRFGAGDRERGRYWGRGRK